MFDIGSAVGSAIGAVGSILGGKEQREGAEAAADATTQAANVAANTQWRMYQDANRLQQPYRTLGNKSTGLLYKLITGKNFDGEPTPNAYKFFEQSPTYNYRLDQETEAINKALAGRGMFNSRAGINAIGEAADRIAADEVDSKLQQLFNLVTVGQGAAANTAVGALNTGRGVANTYANQGSALANIAQTQGNNQASMYTNIAGQAIDAWDAWQNRPPNMPNDNWGTGPQIPQGGYGGVWNQSSFVDPRLYGETPQPGIMY